MRGIDAGGVREEGRGSRDEVWGRRGAGGRMTDYAEDERDAGGEMRYKGGGVKEMR